MTCGVIPRARSARTMPKKPGSPEASTTAGPVGWLTVSRAASRCSSSMRCACGGMGLPAGAGAHRRPARARQGGGCRGGQRAAVAADDGDLRVHGVHAGASAIFCWPVKSTMMTRICGALSLAGFFGAEPAQHAGGAGAQLAARGGKQAGLVPQFGGVPGGVRLLRRWRPGRRATCGAGDVREQGQVAPWTACSGSSARRAASLVSFPAMPAKTTRPTPCSTARRSAAPVKSPTSTKHDLGQAGQQRHGALLGPPAGAQHAPWSSPCAASTRHGLLDAGPPGRGGERADDAGGAEDRDAADDAEPRIGGLARHPLARPGTEMTTRTPRRPRSTASPTACVIIARGTGLIAGPPTSRPRPGLVTTPTPTPPSSSSPGPARQRHRRGEVGAVGDVRVVARVLDDDRLGPCG